MTEAEEIHAQMSKLRDRLKSLDPAAHMTVRELASAAGISPGTAHRFKSGKTLDMKNAIKLLPFTPTCPCCGKPTEKD